MPGADRPAGPIGPVGVGSPSAREKDRVRASAGLDRPAECDLIAFNPDGHDPLDSPADRDAAGENSHATPVMVQLR